MMSRHCEMVSRGLLDLELPRRSLCLARAHKALSFGIVLGRSVRTWAHAWTLHYMQHQACKAWGITGEHCVRGGRHMESILHYPEHEMSASAVRSYVVYVWMCTKMHSRHTTILVQESFDMRVHVPRDFH